MDGAGASRPTRSVSLVDAVTFAVTRTRDVLFRPFRLEKWLVLGFCAWLARLGEGGGGGGSGGSSGWREPFDRHDFERGLHEAWEWLLDHLVPVLLFAGALFVVIVVVWLLVLWLSSRGKFLFLDGVVHDRAAVVEPWRRYRTVGNSLFALRIVLGLGFLFAFLCLLLLAGTSLWLIFDARDPRPAAILAGVLFLIAVLALALVLALVKVAIDDFLVPLMYLREAGVAAAWRELAGLLAARPDAFVLYLLLRFVVAVVVATLSVLSCCLTCCIVLLPYVGTVILLPLHVFVRALPLYFLGQLDTAYARLVEPAPGAPLVG